MRRLITALLLSLFACNVFALEQNDAQTISENIRRALNLSNTGTSSNISDSSLNNGTSSNKSGDPQHIENVSETVSRTTIGKLTLTQGVAQFYQIRNYAPAWTDSATVAQLLHELENLADDGLDPEDYHFSQLREQYAQLFPTAPNSNNTLQKISAQQRAAFDVLATRAYLRSLGHLFRGKINPVTLEPQWNFPRNDMNSSEAFHQEIDGIENRSLAGVYEYFRPQHFFYERTRAALKSLRVIASAGGWPVVTTTTVLKPGMTDPGVAILRQRLLGNSAQNQNSNPDFYDTELAAAVRKYQREQYLNADGVVGSATLASLNIPIQERINQLRINLERGRWLLHDLQGDFVLVDIAGYKIYLFRHGEIVWQSLVQVGKPARKTPIFRANITHVTFNPTWTVPPTIFRKDVMPKVKRNPNYLDENNIKVFDAQGRELDAKTIDWNRPGNITLRQDAGGDDAALGQVAIRFPNPYSVYLHDTPHRDLFSNEQRAFSSGCIRVERPLELVELLFNDPKNWNRDAINQIIATNKTRNVNLPKSVPVLLAYWTVDMLDDGDVGYKPDVYNRDPAVLNALNTR